MENVDEIVLLTLKKFDWYVYVNIIMHVNYDFVAHFVITLKIWLILVVKMFLKV